MGNELLLLVALSPIGSSEPPWELRQRASWLHSHEEKGCFYGGGLSLFLVKGSLVFCVSLHIPIRGFFSGFKLMSFSLPQISDICC